MNKELISGILRKYFYSKPVLSAYLFGSFARGEEDANSDIDILVDLDYKSGGADFYHYLEMQEDLKRLLGRKVDLVSVNGLSPSIAPYVNAEKIKLYEKD